MDTFAATHVVRCALEPGAAAAAAESRKRERYAEISERYIFTPVAVETTGIVGVEGSKLLCDIGGRISAVTKDPRELSWLRQRISIATIRGNSAAVLATAPSESRHPGRANVLMPDARDPRPEEEPEASQTASAVAESSTVSAEATAPLESHHPGCTTRLVADESDPVPEEEPELAQTASAVADRSTFGLLIKQAKKQIAPSDFEVPWGELFGARPKC